jgi:DNA repair protein RecO (recombination protein O)
LRAFEITLLQQTGVLPDLSQVTTTLESLAADTRYAVLPEAGVARARPGEPGLPGSALIAVQAALLHGSLAAVAHACSANLPEWRHVLRGLLHYHLGGPLLRTRKVMLELQGLSTPAHPAPAP